LRAVLAGPSDLHPFRRGPNGGKSGGQTRFQLLFDAEQMPLFVLDERGAFLTVNDSFLDLVSLSREAFLAEGYRLHDLFQEISVPTASAWMPEQGEQVAYTEGEWA